MEKHHQKTTATTTLGLVLIFGLSVFLDIVHGDVVTPLTTGVNVDAASSSSSWSATSRNQISTAQDDLMKKLMSKGCSHRYTLNCLKLDVVSFVDKLAETDAYQVFPGVTVVKESKNGSEDSRKFQADLVASLAKDYPNDVDARVDAFLVKRVGQYLDSHAINVKLFDADSMASARKLGEETLEYYGLSNAETGRKGDKKGGLGQILAMAAMMKGAMGAMAMAGVAAIAGKALITGLMALMLAAIAALKGLSGGGSKAVTYEIVSKPVYSHDHTHSHEVQHSHGGGYGHSSYGRSFGGDSTADFQDQPSSSGQQQHYQGGGASNPADAHEMAYSGYL